METYKALLDKLRNKQLEEKRQDVKKLRLYVTIELERLLEYLADKALVYICDSGYILPGERKKEELEAFILGEFKEAGIDYIDGIYIPRYSEDMNKLFDHDYNEILTDLISLEWRVKLFQKNGLDLLVICRGVL